MAEYKLSFTASQIDTLLNKINNGEVLTAAEKNQLLNINLDQFVKNDAELEAKIANEIVKSGQYQQIRTTVSRVVLGRYIIRYNDTANTLDFSYSDNDILTPIYELGGINDSTGSDESSVSMIRTVGTIEVDTSKQYSVHCVKPCKNLKIFFYNASGGFLSSTTTANPAAEENVKITFPANTAYMRLEVSAVDGTTAGAFDIIDYLDIHKSVNSAITTNSTYEAGSINSGTGATETNTECVRTKDFIPVQANTKYSIMFPQAAKYIRYYFYDSSKVFISASDSLTVTSGGSIQFLSVTNAAFMKIKFTTEDADQSAALKMSSGIVITQATVGDVSLSWERGSFDSSGVINNDTVCARTANPIALESGCQYSITFPDNALWFRYYFYTSDGSFISRSDSIDPTAGVAIIINPPSNAAKMHMKFGTIGSNQDDAIAMTSGIEFKKLAK